jgi:hypothetical protein
LIDFMDPKAAQMTGKNGLTPKNSR